MDQPSLLDEINRLADRERHLRHEESTRQLSPAEHEEIHAIEVHLDQCWDALRQVRARREFGLKADDVSVRPADVVEHYQQ